MCLLLRKGMHDAHEVANYGNIETFTFVWHCIVTFLPIILIFLKPENSPEITK